jgi:hypothetical protein
MAGQKQSYLRKEKSMGRPLNRRRVFRAIFGILLLGIISGLGVSAPRTGTSVLAQTPAVQPLSADDVSWLFPAPTHAEDFSKIISMRDLIAPGGQDRTKGEPVWSDSAFQQFLGIAASPAAQVTGAARIGLPPEAQARDNWFVAGVRIDAGAPGLSSDMRAQFGQSPEIRLVVQLVTKSNDGTPIVHDIAGHLIFDFVSGVDIPAQAGCLPLRVPDLVAFKAIVAELAAMRTKLNDGGFGKAVVTNGRPLGVHPGLSDATTADNLRAEMMAFLERHISAPRLGAMAIMGLPAGGAFPWIFLSMANVPPATVPGLPNGGFVAVPGPTLDGQQFAEMFQPAGSNPRVVPEPHANNRNPITCKSAAAPAGLPVAQRVGSSTSDIFANPALSADTQRQIQDRVADPAQSHFFNTDCVSCHTETRAAMALGPVADPRLDPAVLPNGNWNVRNFGWSPPSEGAIQPTATRRTAAETAAVVSFINSELLAK